MKKLLVLIMISIILVGCSNSTYDKAMEQAKLQLAIGEFDKALFSLELALEEKPKDEEAESIYENLAAYNQVKDSIENSKWDDALTKANQLLEKEKLQGSIKSELEQYIETAKVSKEQDQDIEETADAKATEATEEAEEMEELEAEINIEADAKVSKKEEYVLQLDKIEADLAKLDYLYDSGITGEMREAASKNYERWDKALNDIYGVLKKQLSSDEMSKLKEEQMSWIKYRDNTAKEESLQFEGGTMESVVYTSTLASITKDRCYELVEVYIK